MAVARKQDKWVKRWKVPSSSGNGDYTVAIDKDGNYGCSCPVWKFRRQECHHIKLVKLGNLQAEVNRSLPQYILAKVNKPIYNEAKNELLIPLIAIPDACMMEATICFYMLKYGYSMGQIQEIRHLPSHWTRKAIMAYVEKHGEVEYPEGWYNPWGHNG